MDKELLEKAMSKAEEFQKESKAFVKTLVSEKPTLEYQDVLNTWLFLKLGEFAIKIEELEKKLLDKK